MKKRTTYREPSDQRPAGRVSEPVQVYLGGADLERLERLVAALDATKSEILRRGLEALDALQQRVPSDQAAPMELPTFCGDGLMPGVSLDSSARLLELMDEEPRAAP